MLNPDTFHSVYVFFKIRGISKCKLMKTNVYIWFDEGNHLNTFCISDVFFSLQKKDQRIGKI